MPKRVGVNGTLRGFPQAGSVTAPVPRQQLVEPVRWVIGDAGQHIGEPGLRVDIVHLRCGNEAVHDGGAFAATIGAAEEPGFPAESDTAQGALGGIVRQADAAVSQKAGKAVPA